MAPLLLLNTDIASRGLLCRLRALNRKISRQLRTTQLPGKYRWLCIFLIFTKYVLNQQGGVKNYFDTAELQLLL